jgi:hypothetical protein
MFLGDSMKAETILGTVECIENGTSYWWEGKTIWNDGSIVGFWFDGPEDDPLNLTTPKAEAILAELQRMISLLKANSVTTIRKLAEEEDQKKWLSELAGKPLTEAEIIERMRVERISFGLNEMTVAVSAEEGERSDDGKLTAYWVSFDDQGRYVTYTLLH